MESEILYGVTSRRRSRRRRGSRITKTLLKTLIFDLNIV